MTRLAAMLWCFVLASCGTARTQETTAVDPGAQVTLAPGATVSLKAAEMKVRFVAVTEDSRCPRDVACVWAGEIKVRIEIQQATQLASQVEILEGGSTMAGAYRVTLVRVEPQPMTGAKIAPQDYRATLQIDKAG
jgi:hypothetical protein